MKKMQLLYKSAGLILALTIAFVSAMVSFSVIPATPAVAATGVICEKFGSTVQGNYIVMNNKWGTDATQCINVTNNGFQIVQQDGVAGTNGAPVSYPAIYVGCHYSNCSPNTNLPLQLSKIGSALTSVTLSYPGSGVYDAAYDIWLNPTTDVSGVQATEIMIWLNRTGTINPVGSQTGSFSAAGYNWNVWTGWNGGNNVISYVATNPGITNFNADLKPFLLDSITRGAGYGNTSWYLTSAQMGFEPWQGGVGLSVNSFSFSTTSGGVTPTPVAPTPAPCTSCGTNLALNKPATSSSSESASQTANFAVDGNGGTRWSSTFSDPQWLQIDLGSTQTINRVILNWEAAYATAYQIQVSNDGTNWTSIYSTTSNGGGTNDLNVSGTGRYIRMYGTARATPYGYSLYEFSVYGSSSPTATPVSPTATPVSPTATPTGSISPTAWYKVTNKNSGKCVDARGASAANGTAVQQYPCNGTTAQNWQFQPTSNGYVRVNNRNGASQVWDIAGSSDNSPIQLWSYGGGNNQQWMAVSEGNGYYHFVSRLTNKCLDVPAASTADSVQLVQYTCNGTGAQSFLLQQQP